MGVLAHVFEAAGLSTVSLAKVREWAEAMAMPRALHCDFPLGRPLGKPNDAAYQRAVLDTAFAMLAEDEGPVLRDYPDAIHDETNQPLACPVPPRASKDDSAAVDEALGLRAAYNRAQEQFGRTNVGRVVDADGVPGLIRCFEKVAEGTPVKEAGFPTPDLMDASKDIMSYYEEAAMALSDHVPNARQAESWFFQQTETGNVLKACRAKLMGDGMDWAMYLAPITQQ